ncbi:ankyrin repeat protein [Fusarium flagelliforme]|uniref:Ankyrin repeat protein n=1 Tax=Fusarium flagelliforme TaxID=2675880 RepID=A0A395MDU3_9HYPO|nr:ankyrin repeat protein [Fusarium flagelliforme]
MAEPVSMAASIAGIISLTDTVFRYAFRYSRSVAGAKEDIQRLSEEINSLSAVLRILRALACDLQAQGQEFDCALRVDLLAECERTFEKLKKRLNKAGDDLSGPSKLQALARQLKWPFSASETKELLADVSRYKNTISLAASADSMRQLQLLLSKQSDRFDKIDQALEKASQKIEISTQILVNREKKAVLDFFMHPSLNPQRNLDQSIKWRQPTTGTWLLESEELKQWYSTPGSRLWLKGIPGGGKTVLAGAVIQEALTRALSASSTIGVAFFFCDYKNEATQSPVNILGSIAYQIALQKDEAFEELNNYYQELHPERSLTQSPDTDELRATISRMSKQFDHLYIIIDGVDECRDEVEDVAAAVHDLAEFSDYNSTALFSRDEAEIEAALDGDFRHVAISARNEDIEKYIRAEMMLRESNGRLVVKDLTVKDKIEEQLVRRAKGMFRWVACQLDYMSELWTDADRLKALDHLPDTLHDSYFRILRKINKLPDKTRDMVRLCLQLLAVFPEPLTIQELCQAISTPDTFGAPLGQIVDQDLVARKCSSLIRKSADSQYFEFAHFTVQEFLSDATLVSFPEFASYRISKLEDEPVLGLLCLKFIQLKNFESEPFDKRKADALSFYSHAATRWPQLTANGFQSQELLHAAQSLFRPTEGGIFSGWLSVFMSALSVDMGMGFLDGSDVSIEFESLHIYRPIHIAAALNLPEICSFLINEGVNVNTPCDLGTPMEIALSSFLRHCDWYGAEIDQEISAGGLVPTEFEIDRLRAHVERCWSTGQRDEQLGISLEAFNDYLLKSPFLDTEWGLKLGRLIWSTAVAMELPFTKDSSRTNSKIALSLESLMVKINFAIVDDNCQSLAVCLDDGRVGVNEVGCWDLWPSETLLHNAIRRKAVNCVDLLLERGSDPYAKTDSDKDAVLLSGRMESLDLLEALARHGISLLSVDEVGWNIWHFAGGLSDSRDYRNALFGTHFQESQKGLQVKTVDGMTPLNCAFSHRNTHVLLELISRCNRIPSFWEGQGPIFPYAFNLQSEEIIRSLLRNVLDLESSGFHSATPLHRLGHAASPDWVKFLTNLFPEACMSRCAGRLPLELYVDDCIRAAVVAKKEILTLLTFADVFCKFDEEGRDPWTFLCSSVSRVGSKIVTEVWNCFQQALTHYLLQGCIKCYEDKNRECGLQPFVSMVVQMHDGDNLLPTYIIDHETLNREIGLSQFWKPRGECSVHFLKVAIAAFDAKVVRVLIRYSASLNALVGDETAFHYAFHPEHALSLSSYPNGKEIIELILNTQDCENLKALSKASQMSGLIHTLAHSKWNKADAHWILQLLVEKGLDIDEFNESSSHAPGMAPLTWHLEHESLVMAEVLIDMGANLNGTDRSAVNTHESRVFRPVHSCSISGNVDCLKRMSVVSRGTDVQMLWGASYKSRLDTPADILFEAMTGFHMACFKGHLGCVNFFLQDAMFDKDSTSEAGHTGLHFAAMADYTVIIEQLIRFGCDVMAKCKDGRTPLHYAVFEQRVAAVRTLIDFGAENTCDKYFKTPLSMAERLPSAEITRILEKKFRRQPRASLNDRFIITLLLQLKSAIEIGDLEGCQALISQGCPLNTPIPRTGSSTPLAYSLGCKQIVIAEWLLKKGALVLGVHAFTVPSVDAIMTTLDLPDFTAFLPALLQAFTEQGGNWDDIAFILVACAAESGQEAGLKVILTYLRSQTTTSPLSRLFQHRSDFSGFFFEYDPLHNSAYDGKYGVVQLLLENGAPVDLVDDSGITPLAVAATSRITDLLISFGASPTPLLTKSLAANLAYWPENGMQALESLTIAFLQQSGLPSTKWMDIYLATYHDFDEAGLTPIPSQIRSFMEHCRNRSSEGVNYIAGLPTGFGVRLLFQSYDTLYGVEPFPWHLYGPYRFSKISFLKEHYHHVCRRFGFPAFATWANLEPVQGWSPLCRAASQNSTEKMENCLSLGADIEFEGCPLGSALMIASACGQLDAVKLLVRRDARVCYNGRVGRLSVFKVATSKIVKAWLLVGRFNDQQRMKCSPEHDSTETKLWSGFVQARANLHGYELVRDDESRIDCAKRLMDYKRNLRGRVAPYIDGLIFNNHQERALSAFSSDM